MGYRIERDFLGETADPRRRLLRRPDAQGPGELPHHGHAHVPGALLRQGLRLREEGRRHGEPGPRRARRQDRRRHHPRVRPGDRGRDARPVRDGLHPGRRGHLDQHERQRGDRQPRPREPRPQEGRVPVRQSERPREFRAVHERRLPDRLSPRPHPPTRELHGGAAPAAGGLLRQGPGIRPGPQDGAHPPAGRGPDVPGRRVPRLGHDDRRGGEADRRGPADPPVGQPRGHRDRHHGDGRARLPRPRGEAPLRHHRHQVHPGRGPDRGHLGHRRLRAAVRRAQAHLDQAHQDLQRPPPPGLGAALRAERDQPAADAAGLLDHARAR